LAGISIAAVERIMKGSGAERVSKEAVRLLAKLLEETAAEASRKAVMRMKKANREMVESEDINIS